MKNIFLFVMFFCIFSLTHDALSMLKTKSSRALSLANVSCKVGKSTKLPEPKPEEVAAFKRAIQQGKLVIETSEEEMEAKYCVIL